MGNCAFCNGPGELRIWPKSHGPRKERICCAACWERHPELHEGWNKKRQTLVVVTEDVKEYRATIDQYVNENDTVLEIGCAWGTTTRLLARRCKEVVGIDKGQSLRIAKRRHPALHLERIDGFDIPGVLKLGKKFSTVYIDISGSRDLRDVVSMIRKYEAVFEPEVIVVKSNRLKRLLQRCIVWADRGEGGFGPVGVMR